MTLAVSHSPAALHRDCLPLDEPRLREQTHTDEARKNRRSACFLDQTYRAVLDRQGRVRGRTRRLGTGWKRTYECQLSQFLIDRNRGTSLTVEGRNLALDAQVIIWEGR
jgi:hypothetical protein